MKKASILIFLVFLIFSMKTSAQIWVIGGKKIYGNGTIITEKEPISSFSKVKVIGSIEVVFDTSLNGEIQIEGEENLIPYIMTNTTKKGLLTIKNPLKHQLITKDRKRIKVSIPYHPLDEISLSGTGLINFSNTIKSEDMEITLRGSGIIKLNIETSNLEAKISGSGKIALTGMATNADLTIRGGGMIDAQELKTTKGIVNLSGDASVKVMEKSPYNISKRDSARVLSAEKLELLDYEMGAEYNKVTQTETPEYDKTIKNWKTINDIHNWIKNNFQYDFDRAILLANNSQERNKTTIYAPEDLFKTKKGMCVDLSRFAFETIKSIDPTQEVKYLRIEFEPVEIEGNKFVNHWLLSYKKDDGYYFFADSKKPDSIDGPYNTVQKFINNYEKFRNRKINSFKLLDSYRKNKKMKIKMTKG